MAEPVLAEGCDGGGDADDDEDDECDSDEFHTSMVLRWRRQKKWQKCPKSYNFCHCFCQNGVMIKSVAMIVVPNFSIFEFATAFEVFGIDRSARGNGVPAFDFRVCHPGAGRRPA